MSPPTRKVALTAHVACSVGWFGAVVCVLGLSITGLTSRDEQLVRGVYLAMNVCGSFILLPLSIACLMSGLVGSLGTPWGLFRHYWVIFKLVLNVVATSILLLYTRTLSQLAGVAAGSASDSAEFSALKNPSPLVHAAAAVLVLGAAVVLSIYKPKGLTPIGRRNHQARRDGAVARL